MLKIFTMGSGRTGTKFLSYLFKNNIKNCKSFHEPKPDMFGIPIYWYHQGDISKIRKKYNPKKRKINLYSKLNYNVYLEANHAFLKSFCDIAIKDFPDIKLIHLIRNPLQVTKSQYNRCGWVGEPTVIPDTPDVSNYIGEDGIEYNRWALTGNEKIFKDVDLKLNRYQKLLVQWIEIENRAINFLKKYQKHKECYTIEIPNDIKDENKIIDMFNFFNLEQKKSELNLQGDRNVAKIPTVVTDDDLKQLKELLVHIPDQYLKIFKDKPYSNFEWIEIFEKS